MNEQQFACQIRKHLEQGLHDLPQATADRLAQARRIALAHQKQAVAQSSLATAGSFLNIHLDIPRHYNQLIAALALVAAAVLTTFWLTDRQVNELSEIDSALLAGDLPVNAYTDKGFNAWLKQASP